MIELFGLVASGTVVFLVFDFFLRRRLQSGTLVAEGILLGVLVALSLAVRVSLLGIESGDYWYDFLPWYDYIKQHGGFLALRDPFSSYPPLYLYILTLSSYLPLSGLHAIKIGSLVFDYLAAYWAYRVVELRYPFGALPILAFLAVVFAPTLILNSSGWGQTDAQHVSFLFGSLYFLVKAAGAGRDRRLVRRYSWAALGLFALAFSLKLQAVFFVLPLLFLYVSRRVRWYAFLVILAVYGVLALPVVVLGRPMLEVLRLYFNQVVMFTPLTLNAPTIWALFTGAPVSFVWAGVIFTLAAVLLVAFLLLYRRVPFVPEHVVRVAMVSVLLIPYLLPRMHERYFLAADLVAIIYAFYFPRYWLVPVSVIAVSWLSYVRFLFSSQVITLEVLAAALGIVLGVVLRDFFLRTLLVGQTARRRGRIEC